MIALSNSAFNGASIGTLAQMPVTLFGMELSLGNELSDSFTLPMEPSRDRGMKLVLTPVEEIKDLEGRELTTTAEVTDLYGHRYDISAAIQAAREKAAAGELVYSIEAAEITVPDAVFNRRLQGPQVTVTLNGETLVEDKDYIVAAQKLLEAGTEEITLFGIGDFVGYTKSSFTIQPAESTVQALETVDAGELAGGDVTVLTVDTPAHPDNVLFDFLATDEALRGSLADGGDGRSVLLKKGAPAGRYEIAVSIIGGGENTYSNIDGETCVIDVK